MSIIPWSSGRLLVWDATCSDTFAYFNLSAAVIEAGAVALQTEKLKNNKYSHLDSAYKFVPVAVETCGFFGPQTKAFFLKELDHCLRSVTLDENSYQYLLQKISVAVQLQWWDLCTGLPRWIMWKSDYVFTHYYFFKTILIYKICMIDLCLLINSSYLCVYVCLLYIPSILKLQSQEGIKRMVKRMEMKHCTHSCGF